MDLNKEQKITLIGLLVSIALGGAVFFYNRCQNPQVPDLLVSKDHAVPQKPPQILVHISGEIIRPGVYKLNDGDRVLDAVKLSGGATPQAFLDGVNLAEALEDGQKIEVPSRFDRQANGNKEKKKKTKTKSKKSAEDPPEKQTAKKLPVLPINLNTAVAADLDFLPGIGPSTAQKILDYRAQNGPFMQKEDIMKVKGIGEKLFGRIKEQITI